MQTISSISVEFTSSIPHEILVRDFDNVPEMPGNLALDYIEKRLDMHSPPDPPDIPVPHIVPILIIQNGMRPTYRALEIEINPTYVQLADILNDTPDTHTTFFGQMCRDSPESHRRYGYWFFESLTLNPKTLNPKFEGQSDNSRIFRQGSDPVSYYARIWAWQVLCWKVKKSSAYSVINIYSKQTHKYIVLPVVAEFEDLYYDSTLPDYDSIRGTLHRILSTYCDTDPIDAVDDAWIVVEDPDPGEAELSSPRRPFATHKLLFIEVDDVKLASCGFENSFLGFPKLKDAPPRVRDQLLRMWSGLAAETHRLNIIKHQDIANLRNLMRHNPNYRYTMSVTGSTIEIDVLALPGRWAHYRPVMDGAASLRLEVSRKIVEHARPKYWADIIKFILMSPDAPTMNPPEGLEKTLKTHQMQNLHFMVGRELECTFNGDRYTPLPMARGATTQLYHDPINEMTTIARGNMTATGGFLCDPVGHGKTISVIALITANPATTTVRVRASRATLVVCPPSVLGQWAREISDTAPHLKTCTYHGKDRASIQADSLLVEYDVVLVTYTTYMLAREVLEGIFWHRVIFDESHTMSGRFASTPPASDRRWCVTATPTHNHSRQLQALQTPLAWGDQGSPSIFWYVMMPMTIYRETVLELPTLTTRDVSIEFTDDAERQMHALAFELARAAYTHGAIDTSSMVDVQALLRPLRVICSGGSVVTARTVDPAYAHPQCKRAASSLPPTDPTLVRPADEDCPICYNVLENPCVTTCGHWYCYTCISTALRLAGHSCPLCRHKLRGNPDLRLLAPVEHEDVDEFHDEDGVACMSKLHAVIEMLEKMRVDDSTNKALVFGHSNASLKVLRPMLAQRGFGVRTLHGGMAAPQRASAIGAFQTDPHTTVFLLGVRAASTGINLTAANRIFFLDSLSNSSEETQCIGRAHRLGQTRDVLVSRLFLRDSIESFASHLNCMDLARTMFS